MAKSEIIVIRVDAETKRRFEEAADGLGLTLTSFLLRAAEAAAAVAAGPATAGASRSTTASTARSRKRFRSTPRKTPSR